MLATVISPPAADKAGPALASMLIYLLMAAVLLVPPARAVPGAEPLLMADRRRVITLTVGGVLLALVPPIAALTDQPFYLDLVRRMMIFAIAAVSLDLILGYGGMVSFGHAAYLGIGAYAVGIPAFHGITNGFVQLGLAVVASALVALVIGAISLRDQRRVLHHDHARVHPDALLPRHQPRGPTAVTTGCGWRRAASSAGRSIWRNRRPSTTSCSRFSCSCSSSATASSASRFGMVIRAAKANEPRARRSASRPYRYKLTAFVIAGAYVPGSPGRCWPTRRSI